MKHTKIAGRKERSRRKEPVESGSELFFPHLLKGFAVTVGAGIGCLLTLSAIAYYCADPSALIPFFALLGAGLTALIGGFSTARLHKHAALLCGLGNGGLLLALMLLLSLGFSKNGSGYSTAISLLLHTGIPILSISGAYLGLPKSAPKRRKK